MSDHKEEIENFFAAYAMRSDDALKQPRETDVDGMADAFAPFFVAAGFNGVAGGANDDNFKQVIPQGFARYREVGGKAFRVTRVKVTELDDFNAFARVDWEFDYERNIDGWKGTIAFQNIYFLNFATGAPKIFAYITPDEEKAMRDHGLFET